MKIFHALIYCTILVSTTAIAEEQQATSAFCDLTPSNSEIPEFTLSNINVVQLINKDNDDDGNNDDVEISYNVNVGNLRPFLLITTFLCNSNGQLIDETIDTNHMVLGKIWRRKTINLPVNNAVAGDYNLLITVMSGGNKSKSKSFPITFAYPNDILRD